MTLTRDVTPWNERDLRRAVFDGLLEALIERELELDPATPPAIIRCRALHRLMEAEDAARARPPAEA